MKKVLMVWVVCMTSLLGSIAFAEDAQDYIAQVEVTSRSLAERPIDLGNALAELVVKITKNPAAAQKAEITKAKSDVLDYVMRYQYITEADALDPEAKKLFLQVHFDGAAVQKLLQQAKLAVPQAVVALKQPEVVPQKEASAETVATPVSSPAINPTPSKNSFTIVVQNIDEASDYRTVLGYLSSFESVSKVEIVQLVPPQATFDVTMTRGKSKEKLAELIRLGDILIPAKASEEVTLYEAREDQPLEYRYQR